MTTAAGDGMDSDIRERAVALHDELSSDGKQELQQQPSREAHNRRQASAFDSSVAHFASPDATPPKVVPSLRRIAEVCRPSNEAARVVDVGCGTGALVPFYKQAGVDEARVVGVDLSAEMAAVFRERFPEAELAHADFVDFARELEQQQSSPPLAGGGDGEGAESEIGKPAPIGTVTFNAMFGNLWDQRKALESAARILQEGGKAVISHPLGREFVTRLREKDETIVPHDLPLEDDLREMLRFLPLSIETFEASQDIYLVVMRRTPHRACETVRYLRGEVSRGYGRGSKKLGVPTANLPESLFADNLRSVPTGVYFGWGLLEGAPGGGEDEGPLKCVANIGYSPTFAGQENPQKIVEGHLIGYKGGDFYGRTMRLALVGFQRSERKFASFPELVATINKDVGDAAVALDEPRFSAFKTDAFFSPLDGSKRGSLPDPWSTKDFASAVELTAPGKGLI